MIGKISKQWAGFFKEMFTRAENFGVTCKENCIFYSYECNV